MRYLTDLPHELPQSLQFILALVQSILIQGTSDWVCHVISLNEFLPAPTSG